MAIASFADTDTERIFKREPVKGIALSLYKAAHRKLLIVDAAWSLLDLTKPPGNRLEALAGDRAGQHCIRINDQWRVCFRWKDHNAYDVEVVDYH